METIKALKQHYADTTSKLHLRELLQDDSRNSKLVFKFNDDAILDLTHTKIDSQGLALLEKVAEETQLKQKIHAMFSGEVINKTEKRQVWHVKLREQDGKDATAQEVAAVRQRIKAFSDAVRSGEVKGHTGKQLNTVCAIGIGGSYLGPEFVYEALRFSQQGRASSKGF